MLTPPEAVSLNNYVLKRRYLKIYSQISTSWLKLTELSNLKHKYVRKLAIG